MSEQTKRWWQAAGIRALKTMAQTAVATIGAAAVLSQVCWPVVASAGVLAGILSLLTSVAGLPEVEQAKEAQNEPAAGILLTDRSPVVRQGLLRPGGEDHHWGLWMRPHGHGHGPGHLGRPPGHPGHGVRLGPGTRL